MPKAIITICGTLGADKPKAVYEIGKQLSNLLPPLKNSQYTNMLTLLCDTYGDDYEIVALATDKAKSIQEELLISQGTTRDIRFELIRDDEDYAAFFAQISALLSQYEETIVDISHGFRHLPILAVVALIAQNLKDKDGVKHILFAKELEWQKRYEIIDLAEYLDIATLSYMLSSFTRNYTAVNASLLRTDRFRSLAAALEEFREHMLANSIETIFKKGLARNILEQIALLETDEYIRPISDLLGSVKLHLKRVDKLAELDEYKRLYELGKMLFEKGYLLNAITILNETLPLYVLKRINDIGLMKDMDGVEPYQKATAVGNFISDGTVDMAKMGKINEYFYCTNFQAVFEPLSKLRTKVRKLRNDLAHANGAEVHKDIKEQIGEIFGEFERIAIVDDLGRHLTVTPDPNCEACRMSTARFKSKVNEVFAALFPNAGFASILDKERVEQLHSRENIPKEWRIPPVYTQKQQLFLDILLRYKQAKGDDKEQQKVKMEFYKKFL